MIGAVLTGAFLQPGRVSHHESRRGAAAFSISVRSRRSGRAREAPYTSAKFGLWGLTNATALDGRPHGILCSCLHPGNVRVEWRADPRVPEKRRKSR